MSQILRCEGCDTGYDVSKRTPGKKVRCPRCKTVLIVPEPSPENEQVVTSSSRLRKTRGPVCARHKKEVARVRCKGCNDAVCSKCLAPAPIEHLCEECAATRGLGGALKHDFGFRSTFRLAGKGFFPNFGRIVLWSLSAFLIALLVCVIPGYLGGQMALNNPGTPLGTLGAGLFIASLLTYWVLNNFLLIPAGAGILVDHAIRGRELTRLEAFAETAERILRSSGNLFLIFIVYLLLGLLVAFPGLVVFWWLAQINQPFAALVLIVWMSGGMLFLFAALGLAVPVCLLEEREAIDSLGRAWALSQQRFFPLVGLIVTYYVVGWLLVAPFLLLNWRLEATVLGQLLWLFQPALLVAAYHGLTAEAAGVLGRES